MGNSYFRLRAARIRLRTMRADCGADSSPLKDSSARVAVGVGVDIIKMIVYVFVSGSQLVKDLPRCVLSLGVSTLAGRIAEGGTDGTAMFLSVMCVWPVR